MPRSAVAIAALVLLTLAKFPGTIQTIEKLADGSYVVHVIQSNGKGEVHVFEDKSFRVTGNDAGQGGPPGLVAPPAAKTA